MVYSSVVFIIQTSKSVVSTGNVVCFSVVNYSHDSSLPLAELLNAGINSKIKHMFFLVYNVRPLKLSSSKVYVCYFQVLPNDMLDFLDAPVPYIVSSRTFT